MARYSRTFAHIGRMKRAAAQRRRQERTSTMTTTTVYRIQPAGLEIRGHRSTTRRGALDDGCHVFLTLLEAARAIRDWGDDDTQPELLAIWCAEEDLAANAEEAGRTLVGSKGTIVERTTFANWDALRTWAEHVHQEHDDDHRAN